MKGKGAAYHITGPDPRGVWYCSSQRRSLMSTLRFPDLPKDRMTEAQKHVHDAIARGPRGSGRGSFGVLPRSPELADRVQKLGELLRFNSTLPPRLNEFAILISARYWGSKYEWHVHRSLALKGGLAASIADDVAGGARPARMKDDEAAGLDVLSVLPRRHFGEDDPLNPASGHPV